MSSHPDPDLFRRAFAEVRPLILEEWPELDASALDATEGGFDDVITLVSGSTGHTRAMTRHHLAELLALSGQAEPPPPPTRKRPVTPQAAPAPHGDSLADSLESLVTSVEGHLDDLTREVKRDVAPLAADTAREHLGLVLLITAAVGFAAGLFLGALGYPHDPDGHDHDAD